MLDGAQREAEANPGRRQQQQQINVRARRIREHMAEIGQLAAARRQLEDADVQVRQITLRQEEAGRQKRELEERLQAIGARLAQLQDAETVKAEAERDEKSAAELYIRLTRPEDGLYARAQQTGSLRAEAGRKMKLADAACQKQKAAENAYTQIHDAYIAGYAGRLAQELGQELEQKGEACCPVCRTRFVNGCAHRFA